MPTGSKRKRDEFDFGAGADGAQAPGAAGAGGPAAGHGGPVQEGRGESSWRRGMRRMDESDAFELNTEALQGLQHAETLLYHERKQLRTKVVALAVALVVVLCLSLCIVVSGFGYISPLEVLQCVQLFFQIQFEKLFTTNVPLNTTEVMALQPNYYEVTSRFSISVLTAACGALLALSGCLYQNVFRNPIAAPTMLGVTSGVNIGLVILVIVMGSGALYATGMRYALCYAGSLIVLAIVFLGGRAIGGRGNFNVVNMMLIGSVVSQLVGTVVTFITNLFMDDDMYEIYFELQEQLDVDASIISWVALGIVCVVSITPIVMMRFSLNALSFTEEDSKLLGVNPNVLRMVSLLCGSIMVIAAMIYCGNVSMVSLLVPHIARLLFGSEFRKQLLGNVLIGSVLLLVCRDLCDLIPFLDTGLPIGTMVTFVTLPFFVWMLAVQQRSWE